MKALKISIILSVSLFLNSCKNSSSVIHNFPVVASPNLEIVYPSKTWSYTSPENYGYSKEKLEKVKENFLDVEGDAFLVIKNGYVIVSWGDVSQPIPNRSMRKSYLNSLLGLEYDKGGFTLDNNLEFLNITDKTLLSNEEKKATVHDLMTSSSGIYLEAAYESKEQKATRPKRRSHKIGKHFYYNNWNFNTLGHFYNHLSQQNDIFKDFKEKISDKIGMEDFSIDNTHYKYEKTKSNFPAYLFSTSARDDARLGYLYLNKGKWKDEQIISKEWVDKSTSIQKTTGREYYYDYGYLWWIDKKNEMFIARGNSGQYIAVLPKESMIFVFRADPGSILKKWFGKRVKPQQSFQLISKILKAKQN